MDLSIVIVNWNSKDYLRDCLKSVTAAPPAVESEVIVIDSASFDGCAEMLASEFPEVRFIQSEDNLGFARANNMAFEQSKGEVVLFLNPDTEVRGQALADLYQAVITLPDAGAVGGKLLNSDESIQTSCIKSFPTIAGELLNADVLRRKFPRARLWGMDALFRESAEPSEVDVISGACLMMRRGVFETAGRFSADYFMYSEDVELCFNAQRSGLRNYYVPSAIVVHHGGSSSDRSGVSTFASVMMLEARWKYFRKTRSSGYGILYRGCVMAVSLVRVGIAVILWLPTSLSARGGEWRTAIKKWWSSLRWTVGLERWVKSYGS